jgi:Dolichyl-phosphate-mannose-protein mannosyltransferase
VTPLAATLATLSIFFAPGLVLVAALGGAKTKLRLDVLEQAYLVVAGSLLLSGWVSLVLAEVGWFSPARTAGIVGAAAGIAAIAARGRLGSLRGEIAPIGAFLVAGAILAFSVVVYFPPFEYILGGRDPGIYVNAGFHLARDGKLVYTDPVVESIPAEARPLFFPDKTLPPWDYLRFQGFRLESPATARVGPHGLHLYPVWIGTASALFQMKSGLYATPFFALMAVSGFFLAFRRLFGLETAAWAALLLTVFQIQVWFARFPNSEIVVEFLYATALLLFYFMQERRSTLAGALAGIALGSTFLARVETMLFLVPVAAFFGWKRMRRELGRPELAFLVALSLLAFHAVIHARTFAWPYVSSILGRHYWSFLGDHLALAAGAGVLVFVLVDRAAMHLPARLFDVFESSRIRLGLALLLFFVALYAYFVRPVWHGPHTAPHDAEAFLRMGWYLYPVGLALTIAGAMVLLVRAKKTQTFFLLVALTFSLFFFYKVRVWHDHYFAMRRFVPVILPSFFAAIAVFLDSVRTSGNRLASWGPRVLAAALVVVYLSDGHRLWRHNELRGSLAFVTDLARYIGDDDIVLFPHQEGLHLLELPLSELEERNVLEFYTLKPDRKLLERLLQTWKGRYRDVYFVTNYKISLSGLFTRQVADFWLATEKYEYSYDRPPRGPEPLHLRFSLSKAVDLEDLARRVPKLPTLDVGGSDDLQVAWFDEKEREPDGTTYRWSQKISSIFLPAVGHGTTRLFLRMAGPKENEAPLHEVELSLDGRPLGTVSLTHAFETYELAIPEELASRPESTYSILTMSTETWRPANELPGSTDVRDLGFRLDRVDVR